MEPKSESGLNRSADEVVLHVCHAGVDYKIAWMNIKICVNSELRWPAVNSVKRGNFFVIRTLDKVDSAGRGTFYPGQLFSI